VYTTDNIHRNKKGHHDLPPSYRASALPVSVKATSTKDQININATK
jgi:hypothetical protein